MDGMSDYKPLTFLVMFGDRIEVVRTPEGPLRIHVSPRLGPGQEDFYLDRYARQRLIEVIRQLYREEHNWSPYQVAKFVEAERDLDLVKKELDCVTAERDRLLERSKELEARASKAEGDGKKLRRLLERLLQI